MKVILQLLIILGLLAGTLYVEYELAMAYYPQGCCHDIGSWLILGLMIATFIITIIAGLKVALK